MLKKCILRDRVVRQVFHCLIQDKCHFLGVGGAFPGHLSQSRLPPTILFTLSFSPLALIILNVFCFLFTQIPIEGLNLYIHCPTPTPYLPLRRYNLNTYIPDLLGRHTLFICLRRGSWIGPLK